MNNKYTIRITHPLVRPGLTIETEASEKYLIGGSGEAVREGARNKRRREYGEMMHESGSVVLAVDPSRFTPKKDLL